LPQAASPIPGPPDWGRAVPASFLERLIRASRAHGITRLADVTRLDRLGLPVWQAIRPSGKSLSVHQGKGVSDEAAKVGALCEAFEAHCAENVPADGPSCALAALPEAERAPDCGDYCRMRADGPNCPDLIQWCVATDLLSGGRCWLPHDLISLDFTRGLPNVLERASSGLGAGASEGDALLTSLLEVIERDAVGTWGRLDPAGRMANAIVAESVPYAWFQSWRSRLASLDVALQVFALESVIGVPAVMCVIGGSEAFGSAYRRFSGTAAHGDPEIALFRALAEALQSRLTLIAGVRDDIMPDYYTRTRPKPAHGHGGVGNKAWSQDEVPDLSPETIAGRLAARGYRQIAWKRLDAGQEGIAVTKAFVPGLGSSSRTRRDVK
jgi:ribosomal protein S12 methylthiotransferase accessory factor